MKCIRCGHDSKYKERAGRICPRCRGHFAFEPREGDKLSDAAFQHAVDAVSAGGTVRWGVEHLYYEVCRHIRKRKPAAYAFGCATACIALAAIFVGAGITNWNGIAAIPLIFAGIILAVGIGAIISGVLNRDFVPIDLEAFDKMWSRWKELHGTPAGVIVRLEQLRPLRPVESDIGDYSFDRAVICDRARTVDLLLANNFHFENNCAVLSIDGYPPGPFDTVLKMLKRNPKLQVFALHDASPAGCGLAQRLRTDPKWFAGGVPVVDVGLRPRQTKRFRGFFLRASHSVTDPGLTSADAEWLSRYTLELAVIRPDQLLKQLFRGLNQASSGSTSSSDSDDSVVVADGSGGGGDLGTPAGDSDGAVDSFG